MTRTLSSEVPHSLPRRRILTGSASALAAAGLAGWSTGALAQTAAAAAPKPFPAYADWKNANALILHSNNTMETKRSAYGTSVITPSDQLYVRNNLPPPDPSILDNRDAWSVSIEGVKNPRSLTVGELKTMGLETTTMVLQCSGNGRGFFPSKPSGTQWLVGAAGCVVWSGVPVRAVVEALGGVTPGNPYMTSTGGEILPEGIDPKTIMVERSVPTAAMDDALLAWELNGEPIPLAHGGPLRVIVPGYTGVNSVKYVKRLAFTPKESDAKIMASSYRFTPPGEKAGPDKPSIQDMSVKSWINSPLPEDGTLKAGKALVTGVAFGGLHAVEKVEVSVDGGKSWKPARFIGPDMGKYAWRQFVAEVTLPPGTHTLASRATDVKGDVQPEKRIENVRGYNNTSWSDHAITVTAA